MYRRLLVFVNPFHARHVRELVRSQDERALLVPLINPVMNRLSTAGLGLPFPDMPCMKKVYTNKLSDGTLFSSQEERALLVPLINRG